jgi:hypothetical protein
MSSFEPGVTDRTEFRALISVAFGTRGVRKQPWRGVADDSIKGEDSYTVPSGNLADVGGRGGSKEWLDLHILLSLETNCRLRS